MRQPSGLPLARTALLLGLATVSVAFAAPLDCSNGESHETVYNTTVGSYDILCGVDYAGGDIGAQGGLASFEDCIELCDFTQGCIDVSYGGGNCWMKGSLGTAVSNGGIWTARSRLTRTDNEVTCLNNRSNGTIYDAENGGSYQVLCGIDYAGGDIGATSEPTFSACMDACDEDPRCNHVSYVSPTCYMKDTVTTALRRSYVWTGKKVPKPVTTSSSTSASSTTTTDSSSTTSASASLTESAGSPSSTETASETETATGAETTSETETASVTETASGTETTSGSETASETETASAETATETASTTASETETATATESASDTETASDTATETFSSVSTTETESIATESTSAESATSTASDSAAQTTASGTTTESATSFTITSSISSSAVPTPTAPSCINGHSHKTNFTTSAGSVYEIICDEEYYGGDLSAAGASTFEACIDTCDFTPDCIDISWVGGTCYMKKQLNALVIADGVATARKVQDPTDDVKPPLTCEGGSANGTIFKTDQGKFYQIYCGYDFPGGDFKGLTTDSFEGCLKACDENLGCINVAYVAPACYLKNVLAAPAINPPVWAAKEVSDPGCAPISPTMYPVANTEVDRSSVENLTPSNDATLNYAEQRPGTKAVSLSIKMLYPQITLENSALVSVTCSEGSVVVEASTAAVQQLIMNTWPTRGLVLFTNSPGCNNATSRGVYRTTGAYAIPNTRRINFVVSSENFATVTSEVAIKYGRVRNPDTPSSTLQYTSTCSGTGTESTAPPTSTSSSSPDTPLSPGALALYNALKEAVKYDEDGNIVAHTDNTQGVVLEVKPYDPSNTTEQEALEDKFRQWGMEPPSSLADRGSTGAAGVCSPPTRTSGVPTKRSLSSYKWLSKRWPSWDDFTEFACDDLVGEVVGAVNDGAGAAVGAACAANDLYENRDAIKCLWSNCYTTTITYYTPPPATKYNFDYSWKVTYPALKQTLRSQGANKVLSCENCGFAVSNIQFAGQIVINMTAGVIKEASITAGLTGAASMVAGLKSDGPWSGEWSYTYSTTELGPITLDNAFNIVPSVLYGIGIKYNTDGAVTTTGGAHFNLNNAEVSMNLLNGNIVSQKNWAPQITFTNPTFTTGANLQMTPYMRWAVNLAVNIYGQVALSPTITSETVVGLGSTYSFSAQSSCPANNLQVTSYVSTKNSCFNVPSNQPSPNDLAVLSSLGGAYCTSYINYRAPTAYQWITTSSIVPSTTTSRSTTTITSTPTITIYPTTSITTYYVFTKTLSTITATATNNKQFPTQFLRKRLDVPDSIDGVPIMPPVSQGHAVPVPVPTATPPAVGTGRYVRRQAPPPAVASVVSGWPASKISYACSQVATGKVTITSTLTSTTTSGVVTVTQAVTANAQGPLSTITSQRTTYLYGGFSTVTVPGPTTTTKYSCPVQTQVSSSSCLKLKINGPAHINGQPFGYQGLSNPFAHPIVSNSVWHLSCNGTLNAFTSQGLGPLGGLIGQGYFFTLGTQYWETQTGFAKANCVKDEATKRLDCTLGPNREQMQILPATYAVSGLHYGGTTMDQRVYYPLWDASKWNSGVSVITLTYEEVDCPCVWT
ncbi:hypothetical protein B0T21DRAFT_410054 [Apiosordaria backusii]|uniref:Apple domain-containing protein n=1 Tax=Apiosordaria backusii TaxID=314023 RepID=A0AA40BST4_9PEZI|nr:hypothetical protein B0T21DRAFT_410054 [Apiosordaria backusii]